MQRLEVLRPIRYHSGSQIKGLPVFLSGQPGHFSLMNRLGRGITVGVLFAVCCSAAAAKGPEFPATVPLSELPVEARTTHERILAGGPFTYPKDGIVFSNRERALPFKPRGYYHEYTVTTPGAHNRGARRIVCGGRQTTQPDACFYTADHYASFRRISHE